MKRVLITGASGLGLAIARRFIREGCKICLLSQSEQSVREALRELGDEVIGVTGSVTRSDDIHNAVQKMKDNFGGIDCAIACAGINVVGPSLEVSTDTFRNILEVNVVGSFLLARAAATEMMANNGGSILFISSVYGETGAPQRAAYCASKGALHSLTESLAVEWGRYGIRVNAVAPTGIRSKMVQSLIDQGNYNLAGVQARTPLGRLAEPDEVADACYFLSGDQATMITGHVLPVDGGWLANGYIQ